MMLYNLYDPFDEQLDCIKQLFVGNVVINAIPGSGKTTTSYVN